MNKFIADNISIVPKNQVKKFQSLTENQQVEKIKFYQDIAKMRAEARFKNSVLNKTKELFEKKHASVDDANQVIKFCEEYVEGFRQRQIAELDEQIAILEEKKRSL